MDTTAKNDRSWPASLIIIAIGGCVLHLILIFSASTKERPIENKQKNPSFVEYIGHGIYNMDTALAEQSILLDYEPVFLSTQWNHQISPDLSAAPDKPANIFNPYPSEPLLDPALPANSVSCYNKIGNSNHNTVDPLRALDDIDFPPISKGFGLKEKSTQPRIPAISIKAENMSDSTVTYKQTITDDTVAQLNNELWNAESFLAIVDPSGFVQAIPTKGSPSNAAERDRLTVLDEVIANLQLPPGHYRITFQP